MKKPFYENGLSFACTRCSRCCVGQPGHVFLSKDDVQRLLILLSLDFRRFYEEYCISIDTGEGVAISLRETGDHACILWSVPGCSVYDARPIQCSTYPFWSSIIESPESWSRESAECPGIGIGNPYERTEIESALYLRRSAGILLLNSEMDFQPELLDEDKVLGR
jgi:hypothetical protein